MWNVARAVFISLAVFAMSPFWATCSGTLFCVAYGCVYLAIKQSYGYDTNNWHHGQITYRFIPEASNYTEHPEWDHYSNNPFVSHKFLVSEIVKMNGQESVNSYRENTKKWDKNKKTLRDGICFNTSPISNNVVSVFTVFSYFHRKICNIKWLDKKTYT